jgi:hypothetical protein
MHVQARIQRLRLGGQKLKNCFHAISINTPLKHCFTRNDQHPPPLWALNAAIKFRLGEAIAPWLSLDPPLCICSFNLTRNIVGIIHTISATCKTGIISHSLPVRTSITDISGIFPTTYILFNIRTDIEVNIYGIILPTSSGHRWNNPHDIDNLQIGDYSRYYLCGHPSQISLVISQQHIYSTSERISK